jgi:hypothetical protein
MTDSFDYPAAHSMDTTWFAVDRDGLVAAFDSGEAGAVPDPAYLGDSSHDVVSEIYRSIAKRPIEFLRGGRLHFDGEDHYGTIGKRPVIVFVEQESQARPLIAEGGRAVPASRCFAVVATPSDTLQRLHDRGECLGCFEPWLLDAESDGVESLATRGLYHYVHELTENWLAGPYGQHARPTHPITVDALPAAARRKLAKFPGLFRDTLALQPTEFWKSASWDPAYLTSDLRNIAAMPGREADYEAAFEELSADLPAEGITVLRPGESPAANTGKPWWKIW